MGDFRVDTNSTWAMKVSMVLSKPILVTTSPLVSFSFSTPARFIATLVPGATSL